MERDAATPERRAILLGRTNSRSVAAGLRAPPSAGYAFATPR